MAQVKITEKEVKNLAVGAEIRDVEQTGFYARRQKKSIVFYYSYISPETQKRRHYPLGVYGSLTVDAARKAVKTVAGQIANGIDPQEEKTRKKLKVKNEKQRTLRTFMHGEYTELVPKK